MWPWRKRSGVEKLALPKKYFISHSYKDAGACQRLFEQLQRDSEPFVFPPITVPPEQMISDRLLDAIHACDGLIYIQGGASAESFWVALERDYALRVGKPVFAFDPLTGVLSRDLSSAMELRVFVSHAPSQWELAGRIVETMQQRFIDVWSAQFKLLPGTPDWESSIRRGIEEAIEAGGYVVALWSSSAVKSLFVAAEAHLGSRHPNRVLFAILEGEQPPVPFYAANSDVVLVYGDDERSFVQRVDDLIVRLYWLIYRNTRQNQLS